MSNQPTELRNEGDIGSETLSRERREQTTPNDRESPTARRGSASVPLLEGEEVLIDERPAWSAWSVHLLVAGLVFLGSVAAGELLAGIVGTGLIVGYVWYQRSKVTYVVTDRRVVVVTGHSSRSTNETWMEDVRGMQTGASAIEQLLGHGHITISHQILPSGFGRFKGLTLGGVPNYEEIATVIRKRQSERKSADH